MHGILNITKHVPNNVLLKNSRWFVFWKTITVSMVTWQTSMKVLLKMTRPLNYINEGVHYMFLEDFISCKWLVYSIAKLLFYISHFLRESVGTMK